MWLGGVAAPLMIEGQRKKTPVGGEPLEVREEAAEYRPAGKNARKTKTQRRSRGHASAQGSQDRRSEQLHVRKENQCCCQGLKSQGVNVRKN